MEHVTRVVTAALHVMSLCCPQHFDAYAIVYSIENVYSQGLCVHPGLGLWRYVRARYTYAIKIHIPMTHIISSLILFARLFCLFPFSVSLLTFFLEWKAPKALLSGLRYEKPIRKHALLGRSMYGNNSPPMHPIFHHDHSVGDRGYRHRSCPLRQQTAKSSVRSAT